MVELLDFYNLTHIPLHDERDRSFRILPSSNPDCRSVYFGIKRRPIRIMYLRLGVGRTSAISCCPGSRHGRAAEDERPLSSQD
jgi:hypothetical protein